MMSEPKKKHRYKNVNGKRLIEVKVKSTPQLFDARDPAPFRERDLDDAFIEYIMAAAREFSLSTTLKIIIHIEEFERKELPRDSIREAIHSYLSYQIEIQQSELKRFLKRAQMYLLIGLLILVLCLGVAQQIIVTNPPGLSGILRDGIVIFGWVSIWKPIELILFDWYPLYEKIQFHRKLLATEIEIKFSST